MNEHEKRIARMNLNFAKDYSVPANTDENGNLMFSALRHYNKQPSAYKLPRALSVSITHLHQVPPYDELEEYARDTVQISPMQFEYILDLLRQRVEHIKVQPGSISRSALLEEHAFVVDIICTLDI